MDLLPLNGRTALVTGVSRRRGIGFAIARKLAALGASVFIHHYRPHDEQQPWGADDLTEIKAELTASLVGDAALGDISADLSDPEAPATVVGAALRLKGRLDILVCNHARSGGDGSIMDMTAAALDDFWAVDARSTLLLTREFAEAVVGGYGKGTFAKRPGERLDRRHFVKPVGRVVWMTSGQNQGPMPGEVAYAASKAALTGVTATVAAELLNLGIALNTVNPGPVNTGYLDPETTDRPLEDLQALIADTPFGRFGEPRDAAELIGWLMTDAGAWIIGQVLTSDGGFSLQ